MASQLSGQPQFRWKFCSAVDGHLLPESEIDQINQSAVRTLTRGEIGCALSHKKVWEMATLEKSAEHTWVMEDDVSLLPAIADLESILSGLGKDREWDILYMTGDSNTEYFFEVCDHIHLKPYLEGDLTKYFHEDDASRYATQVGPQIGAYSYILSSSGLKKVRAFFETLVNPVDVQIGQMNDWLSTFMAKTCLVQHEYDGTSDSRL